MACLCECLANHTNAQVELLSTCVVCRARWWKIDQCEIGVIMLRHLMKQMTLSTAERYQMDSLQLYTKLCHHKDFENLLGRGSARDCVSALVEMLTQIFHPAPLSLRQLQQWMRVNNPFHQIDAIFLI